MKDKSSIFYCVVKLFCGISLTKAGEGVLMMDLIGRLSVQENFVWEKFVSADAMFQPAYTWIWNAPLSRGEIKKQLDAMEKAGIRTVYVLPEPKDFRIYNKRMHMVPDYLSKEFFQELRYAMEYALEKGMRFWMYDEGGWPSGSACGEVLKMRPDLCRKEIAWRKALLNKGEKYLPGDRAIVAFAVGPNGKASMVAPREMVEEDTELVEYYVKWQDGIAVDSLDEESGRMFIATTHERYKEFLGDLFGKKDENGNWICGSNRLPLMFTDEPGAGRYAWPRNFEKRFYEVYGYEIAPYVPVLVNDSIDVEEAGTQARIDYRELAGNMFRENYFKPIHEWCRKNNVLSTGHLDIDHKSDGCIYHNYGSVLSQLREMDIPGIDAIWRQIAPPVDGEPACAEGNGFFPRLASSAAAQSGGKYALSESFAVYGAGLTGEEMRFVVNYQLVRGINIFNIMSMSYGKNGAAPTIMRPSFVAEMPGYDHLAAVNEYTARASYLMQLGESGVQTALYLPNRDIWAAGTRRSRAIASFDALGKALEMQQVEFDIVDDEALRMARRVGNELHIGLAKYCHILVPECEKMPEDVAEIVSSIDHQIVPALHCVNCSFLRIRTRKMPDGSVLWMLFNESEQVQSLEEIVLPGAGNGYRLDAALGRVEKVGNHLRGLILHPGEAQFYLYSSATLRGATEKLGAKTVLAEIFEFSMRKLRKSWIDSEGIHDGLCMEESRNCTLGDWINTLGKEFSGEVVYTTEVKLEQPLQSGKMYALDLGKVECSACVSLDGKKIGIVWATPKTILFDGAVTSGRTKFVLEIVVANTLANQYNAKIIETMYLQEDYGPYQEKLKDFERDAPAGGLYGPVILYGFE